MFGVKRNKRGVSRLSSAEVKVTNVSTYELMSLSLPHHFPSLHLPSLYVELA